MSASYKVLAPYVTLKVKDINGQEVVQGFYEGAVVSDPVENDSLDKHVRTKLVEKVKAPKGEAQPAAPVGQPPAGNASREEWAAYAKDKKGAPDEETRPVEEGGLKQTELREKYGN
jgi:hypothetical protein